MRRLGIWMMNAGEEGDFAVALMASVDSGAVPAGGFVACYTTRDYAEVKRRENEEMMRDPHGRMILKVCVHHDKYRDPSL